MLSECDSEGSGDESTFCPIPLRATLTTAGVPPTSSQRDLSSVDVGDDDEDDSSPEDEPCSEPDLPDDRHCRPGGCQSETAGDRKKVGIEYIQQRQKRTSAFRKRKSGLMKKGYELGKLTGAEVLVVVVREGMMFSYGTPKLRCLLQIPSGKELLRQCVQSPLSATDNADGSDGDGDKSATDDVDQWKRHQIKQELTGSPPSRKRCYACSCDGDDDTALPPVSQFSSLPPSSSDLPHPLAPAALKCQYRGTKQSEVVIRNANMPRPQVMPTQVLSSVTTYMSEKELQTPSGVVIPSMMPTTNLLSGQLYDNKHAISQFSSGDGGTNVNLPMHSQEGFTLVPTAKLLSQLPNGSLLTATPEHFQVNQHVGLPPLSPGFLSSTALHNSTVGLLANGTQFMNPPGNQLMYTNPSMHAAGI
ncbi:serum response factor-like [Sycon ciliatum]|uniref:serum response factor-like n=1 Tax=Sycon ciliatum TaxID=27933 RepID=UPI0031F66C0A